MLLRDPKRLLAVMIAGVAGLIVLLDFAGAGGMFALLARGLVDWAAVITSMRAPYSTARRVIEDMRSTRAARPTETSGCRSSHG